MVRICSETITHGQRYLLDLLDRHVFFAFADKMGLSRSYMHKVAAGKFKPPCRHIYTMRNVIYPALWFIEEHEPVPENPYKPTRKREWDWKTSQGMRRLQDLTADSGVRAWALKNGLDYYPVWMESDQSHELSYNKIIMLEDHIDPASWFFYEVAGN
ncbi:hypothetical protein FACS189473_2070 [Spirochaetia bacterium]|nr:hypothetical protein FACS189473_2070 [Spirochaetia bacterium]